MTGRTWKLSVIIPARNEAATLHDVLVSSKNLRPHEIIVVANGCTDATVAIAERHGCRVIVDPEPLGNDIGRAVGAACASGDVLLFLDGDFALPSDRLRAFLEPIYAGEADAVLNDLDGLYYERKFPHSTTVWRQVFNAVLQREDLRIDSMLSVPHAMTREALAAIGVQALGNPALAHLKLVVSGLRIRHSFAFDVIRSNKYRPGEHDGGYDRLSSSEKRIIGDHLAALAYFLKEPRGGFTDGDRRRDLVEAVLKGQKGLPVVYEGWKTPPLPIYGGNQLSVVIPAQDEERTIGNVIGEARKLAPCEIIAVVNGSADGTAKIAMERGAKTLVFPEPLGNDVGRAIGAMAARGDIVLFLDGDIVIDAKDLYPFVRAVQNGVDMALNDLNHYLYLRYPLHLVTAFKYALNLALDQKQLGVASMIAVPHALSRRALNEIGRFHLLSPAVAQVRAALKGLKIAGVHRIDVDRINRLRPSQHFALKGHPPATNRIIGDHIEGFYQLIKLKGDRGLFTDRVRKWERIGKLR